MRLYLIPNASGLPTWAGTQVDARAAAGGPGWQQFDVPTDKEGLLDFLNRQLPELAGAAVAATAPESAALIEAPAHEAPAEPEPQIMRLPAPGIDEAIEMIGTARGADFGRLVEAAVDRVGELGEEAFEALDTSGRFQGVGGWFSRGVHILSIVAAGEHQLAQVLFRSRKSKPSWGGPRG